MKEPATLSVSGGAAVGSSALVRPLVVCLCGSTRFKTDFEAANREATMKGAAVGLAVRSEATGAVVTFFVSNERRQDGEVTAWELEPLSEEVRANPALSNLRLVVFND